MIFLKQFYANGFKSFARPVTLKFDSTMVGIIGPNGAGKSNVIDALRWVIGEQSNKSLRGKEKMDMIFMGSNDMDPADRAIVELTFDNTDRVLSCDLDEVCVSRELIRKTGETIYRLNGEQCLLRDIQALFADTGLGKGSLGLISQGQVNWFAEAKPEERRQMFESAAGIGKYTRQKEETLQHLEKANENLKRLEQHTKTLKREISDLNHQVEKAKLHKEKNELLKRYDVSISVQDYLSYKDELNEISDRLAKEIEELDLVKINCHKAEKLKINSEEEFQKVDKEVSSLYEEREKINKKLTELNYKKSQYTANLESQLSSEVISDRVNSLKQLIASEAARLESLKRQFQESSKDHEQFSLSLVDAQKKTAELQSEYNNLNREWNDKKQKLNNINERIKNSTNHERGVNELLKARNVIRGIHNTIGSLINVPSKYEVAIQIALGKSINNIVVDDDKAAIAAIKYLKDNHAGRATLLPLNNIKPKEVKSDSLLIMRQSQGFLGVASNLIEYDPAYTNPISSLLGNVGIVDDIENANIISKRINFNYKIITLDGDTIFSGGAMSGGQQNHSITSTFNLEEKLKIAQEEYDLINERFQNISIDLEAEQNNLLVLNSKFNNSKLNSESLKRQVEDSNEKINRYKTDLESFDLSYDENEANIKINNFELELNQLNEQSNVIQNQLNIASEQKELMHDKLAKYRSEYDVYFQQENQLTNNRVKHESRIEVLENNLSNIETKINNTYSMTMDSAIDNYSAPLEITIREAKQIIEKLRAEIAALGKINFDALDSLESKQKELDEQEKQYKAASDSVNSLLSLVESLDKRAKDDFMNVINNVNEIIPSVFKSLFGGGSCRIQLTDPDNILESGIEVLASPPGKKVNNLVLFSGGEKTLIALAVLFSLLKSSKFPLVLLDEVEAALDQANVSTYARLIKEFSETCQFIVITHRSGTMSMCKVLYGATMLVRGVTEIIKQDFDAIKNQYKK